jgi:hypothetical protein
VYEYVIVPLVPLASVGVVGVIVPSSLFVPLPAVILVILNLFSVTVGQYNSPFSLSSPQAAQSRSMFIVGAGNPHYKQNALEIYNNLSTSTTVSGSIIIQ